MRKKYQNFATMTIVASFILLGAGCAPKNVQPAQPDPNSAAPNTSTSMPPVVSNPTPETTGCPSDTKQCPDGSIITRKEPNCEFVECTVVHSTLPTSTLDAIVSPKANANVKITPPTTTKTPTPVAKTNIDISDFKFQPQTIDIPLGTKVTWTNKDSAPHTVTADNKTFDSGTLQKGQSFTFTFDKVGTFTYYCALHPSMKGTIVVK